MDLESIAHYFIDKLSVPELETLKQIAHGLSSENSEVVKVGTTCSGIESGIVVVKALFAAINQRFGTNVRTSGVFAAEIDDVKRQFIVEAHGQDIQHIFGDVKCFSQTDAFCYLQNKMVKIPSCFLLIAGTSCVNLSRERSDRQQFAACYTDGSGESGHTYEYGFRTALKTTGAKVTIFENVLDASFSLKDANGVAQPPATDIIAEDLQLMGHKFEFVKACSSNFLLPQRRSRVWGSSCSDESISDYELSMRLSMLRMQSSMRFSLDDILDKDLPKKTPTSDVLQDHIQTVKKICSKKGLDHSQATLDTAASSSRGPEWTHGMLTCCRPSHQIYHVGLERLITGMEMLKAHGIHAESSFSILEHVFSPDPWEMPIDRICTT